MCNYRHPDPRRVWEVGSEPQSLTPSRPLPQLRRPRRRIPKTAKMLLVLYASLQSSRGPRTLSCDAQAAELVRIAALPCTREHRKINFHQKNTCDLEDLFFVFLPKGARHLIFTMNYHLREDQVFTILTPNWPNSTSGPRGASRIQCGHNLTQSGSNLISTG